MTFIETVPEADATGAVQAMYETDRELLGELPNFTRAYSHRPEVYAAWRALNGTIKGGMDLRRYELATIAAARRLRSSYCSLAHGSVLLNNEFVTPDALRSLMNGGNGAGLSEVDVAVMDLADKVAADATSVTQADIDRLRDLGLSDTDITDVILAAAARSFFSKSLDALGVAPDAKYNDTLDPAVRDALTVGRPIAAE